ncbi:MAG: DUF1631 family protein [Pseudomonadales bacterium]|nr:DUF1631 family protein [Pseudomonadales bacterium]
MDKRRSPRYAVQLNALVHPNAGRSWLCTIQDFCEGGMLLVEQDGARTRSAIQGVNPGEKVGIHFSVPGKPRDRHFRLEGNIVRVLDTGVGIKFGNGMDEDAMTALLTYSNSMPLTSRPAPVRKPGATGGASAAAGNRTSPQASRGSASPDSTPASLDLSRDGNGLISPQDAKRVIGTARRALSRILLEMNSAFFSYMDDELLKLARDAKSNAEQSDYFAAMTTLEKAKKEVGQAFSSQVLDQIDKPRDLQSLLDERKAAEEARKQQQQQQRNRIKLSLVNTDDFEDWLAVANIISRSERAYEKYLQELLPRMGMLVDSWAHKEANPLGTSVVCHAFDNAIRNVELSKEIRQKVYSGFESKAVPLFRKLYVAVTQMLEESKLFPDLDDDYIARPAAIRTTPEPVAQPEPEVEKPAAEPVIETVEEAPDDNAYPAESLFEAVEAIVQNAEPEKTASPVAEEEQNLKAELERLRQELRIARGEIPPQAAEPPAAPPVPDRPAAAPVGASDTGQFTAVPAQPQNTGSQRPASARSEIGQAISDIYATVRGLISRRGEPQEQQLMQPQEYVELDEVQEMLRTLRPAMDMGQRVNVREQLLQQASLNGGERVLAPQVAQSLDVVENLVDTIEQDALLSSSAKNWIRQLELTLDKVAASTGDILNEENPHQALEVINQLARLGGAESASIQRDVESIVQNINQNYDADPGIFDEALGKLQPLVERQSRAFTGNVQRTVKASEGQQTLINAQRAVVSELDQRLVGREVPEIIMKLLMPGWRNLMVNTHLRKGQESADWQQHIQALDQVVQQIEGTADSSAPDYIPPEQLLNQIEAGLDSISFEPGQRQPLISSLRKVLVDGTGKDNLAMVQVPATTVAEALGFGDVSSRDEKRKELLAVRGNDADWVQALERVKRLYVGEWLEFSDQPTDNQIAIVAWISEDKTTYVFVNRRGVKIYDLVVEELATKLVEGTARILDETDVPLTDRASHKMLQNMHNQLTHQATHDELTGLINRKEFERELTLALADAKKNDLQHVVAYLDLDQFKVINNTAGHEAGDTLLRNISGLLAEVLEGQEYRLSRLGGDEFGILIQNCNQNAADAMIKRLCRVVKDYQFSWEGSNFRLTTSCGVVNVDKDVESVAAILQGADSACYAAKDAGRDRVHIYQAADTQMAHRRDVMDFVSQIDNALENDRFVLNCQQIAPIDPSDGALPHYEILLTVLDSDNNPLPPQDFIVAAETYNRMSAIDRWVIRNTFAVLAAHQDKLGHLGEFSINISGNSLNEDDFMDFVLDCFNESGLPTSRICFEITETSAIGSLDKAVEFMEKMKVIGVQFSLDDFGTGLSSYSYLRNMPVDFLKIDGIFVKDIKTNPSDYAVVKSINEIGHFMGKQTIAEYVEDDEILEILREIGVDFAQGYGVGKKFPLTQLIDSLS